ncbi:MAG: hypothetical protein CL840_05480 [Crocinitomicaceae bacterium]|nr:hypothetical protein [Crocinitomicaceae bacterium]
MTLLFVLSGIVLFSCKKEENHPIPNPETHKPRITLVEPALDTTFSNQRELYIKIKSEFPTGIDNLEFRLYRFTYYGDTVEIYHHWEGGEGTTIEVEKKIRRNVAAQSRYWIKANSEDTNGNKIDTNFFFWFTLLAPPKINLYPRQPQDPEYGILLRYNSTYTLLVHLYSYFEPNSLVGAVYEKGSNKLLSRSPINDLSAWNNNNQIANLSFKLGSNPFPGDTTFAYFELTGTNVINYSSVFITDCFIVD